MKNLGLLTLLFALALFSTSCTEVGGNRQVSPTTNSSINDATDGFPGNGSGNGSGNGAVGGQDDAISNAEEVTEARVEIRHLIEPKVDDNSIGGSYLSKMTLPKNYDGLLYIAGINFSTLATKNIFVRFNFGVNKSPIDVQATIGSAEGLTSSTGVDVLILDMRRTDFGDINLIYDLYDYNDYDFSGTDSSKLGEPVQFNRDAKLYCRGVSLEDDPTFTGSLSEGCVKDTDMCLYSFAKIFDQGLFDVSNNSPIIPTEANIQSGDVSYYSDSNSVKLDRCLPDNGSNYTFDLSTLFTPFGSSITIDGRVFQYQGPYRASAKQDWQIGEGFSLDNSGNLVFQSALTNPQYGIFSNYVGSGVLSVSGSKMFPLATQVELLKDVEYLGSAVPDGTKSLLQMNANGDSQWLDGCNARATSTEDVTGEHVGSCNVTATIEIYEKTSDDNEVLIASSSDVKLQLVKPSVLNTDGENILSSSYQSCSSSNQCGTESCCISGRCWSKSLVSSCVEDLPIFGNLEPGDTCASDYECSSFCCSQTTGRCAVHDTLQEPQVLCSKASGQSCIAREWCGKQPVTRCFIVKTGQDAQGSQTCDLKCYTFEEYGDCTNGICQPPPQPNQPTFNPNDPNRCVGACDPPDFSNGYFDIQCGGGSN